MDEKFTITHKELNNFFTSVKEELIVAIENKLETKIETKVNGKIKEIAGTLKEHGAMLENINVKILPVLEERRDKEGIKRLAGSWSSLAIGAAACIGALYAISQFITNLGK